MIKTINKMFRRFLYIIRYFPLLLKKGLDVEGLVLISRNVKIIIEDGAKLKLGRNVRLEHDTVIYCKKGSMVVIGQNTSTGHHTEISCNNHIDIGKDIIMGAFTYITDSNHRYDIAGVPIAKQGMTVGKTKIGSNVWLGRGAMVLKDAEVGDNSVIGANSVVTKRFKNNCVLGGIPARVIKEI